MSTQQVADSSRPGMLATTQAPLVSTFVAVILGSSLIEFNELLFPPKLTNLNFWALLIVYYGAFATWFGMTATSRSRPYNDTTLARLWLTLGVMMLVSYLALMFLAFRVTDSLFYYMWGWVVVFVFYWTNYYARYRDLRLPEPLGLCATHGLLALAAAIAYSIWSTVFTPVPTVVNWVFVIVAFGIIFSYRSLLRKRHAWQPIPTDQQ